MTRTALVLCGVFAIAVPAARAQSLASFDGVPREQLFQRSWDSPSRSEKVVIRHYLAQQYPTTVEGLFAKAWLLSEDGRGDQAIAAYRDLLRRFPDHLPTLYNLGISLTGQDKIDALEKLLALDPRFNDAIGVRLLHDAYSATLGRPRADRFLDEWEAKLPGQYIFDYIRGLRAAAARDWAAAETHYVSATGRPSCPFEVYQALVDVRVDHLIAARDRTAVDLLTPFAAIVAAEPYRVLSYVAGRLKDVNGSASAQFQLYLEAFEAYPTAEAAQDAYRIASTFDAPIGLEFLRRANDRLPDNPLVLSTLAAATARFANDPKTAEALYLKAIEQARTEKTRSDIALDLGDVVYEDAWLDYDRAAALFRQYVRDPSTLARRLYSNRLYAQDFAAARKYLADYEAIERKAGKANDAWFRDRYAAIARYAGARDERMRYAADNPFLNYWQDIFGEGLTASVPFAKDADAISPEAEVMLGRVARLLKEVGADRYVFSIEGHADRGEADPAGIAERRAQAVSRYLFDRYSVPLHRMQRDAFGADRPSGGVNARVEILPLGDLTRPTIAVTSTLEAGQAGAISPDGRYLAVGTNPIQLWDAQRGVRLRDLGSGLNRKFSPNGRLLAVQSRQRESGGTVSNALAIYDVKTGLAVATVPSAWETGDVVWSPSSREVAFTNETGQLLVCDVRTGRLVRATRLSHMQIVGVVAWTPDGRYIVSGQAQAHVVHVHDAATLKVVRTLIGVDWPHELAVTPDGQYLVVADNKRTLSVWDMRSDGEWPLRQMTISALALTMDLDRSAHRAVLTDFGKQTGPYDEIVVDLDAMRVVAARKTPDERVALFAPDGRRIYDFGPSAIAVLNPETLEPAVEIEGTAVRPRAAASDRVNGFFLTSDSEGLHVWDIRTGKRVHSWRDSVRLLGTLGPGVFVGAKRVESRTGVLTDIVLYRTADFTATTFRQLEMVVEQMSVAGDRVAFAGLTVSHAQFTRGRVFVCDRQSGATVGAFDVPLVTAPLEYDRSYAGGFAAIALSPDAREIIVSTYWQDGFGHGATVSEQARLLDAGTGAPLLTFRGAGGVLGVGYQNGSPPRVMVATAGSRAILDRQTGKLLETQGFGANEQQIPIPNGSLVWSGKGMRIERNGRVRDVGSDYALIHVDAFPDRRLIVALNSANEIAFFDLDGDKQLSIVSKREGEWIAFAPTGEFVSSLLGANKVFWSLGDRTLPFDALKAKFEQPGIIADRLTRVASGSSSRPIAPGFEPEVFGDPYTVAAVTDADLTTTDEAVAIEFSVEKRSAELPAPVLRFRHQGVELPAAAAGQSLTLVRQSSDGRSITYRRMFSLADGLNLVDVDYEYGGTSRRGVTFRLQKNAGSTATSSSLVQLWYLGIGTNYANRSLQFADKDVTAMAEALKAQEGRLFSKVETKLLLNEEVTNEAVQAALYEFLGRASSLDMIVIHLAGHGVMTSNQRVAFMPYAADLQRPYLGLDLRVFQEYLRDNRVPTQKALFLLDICHSGAQYAPGSRGIARPEDALRELQAGTGLVVFAASTDAQQALEDPSYRGGHGAFTAALLEGLEGAADQGREGEKDGRIMMLELLSYVSSRVPEMTKGRQRPTTPRVEGLRDFPVARVSKK